MAASFRDDPEGAAVIRKVRRRLLPVMFVLYVVAYLDRINVGFAALQMNRELALNPEVFGFGAGIFFVGYFLFEIPSNLILEWVGARLWIARIMISWGLIACAMALVRGPWSFYFLRLMLGIAEAGFFPGMILYLTYWLPPGDRARALAEFMAATTLAGVIGGPVSGLILSTHGWLGISGWQWLFVVEGLPAVILGMFVPAMLTDKPEQASWLTPAERDWLAARLRETSSAASPTENSTGLGRVMADSRVWTMAAIYLTVTSGIYGLGLWLPQMIKQIGNLTDLQVGMAVAVPYALAALAMMLMGASSDRHRERRFHFASAAIAGGTSLLISAFERDPIAKLIIISVAAAAISATVGPFWAMPSAFLSGTGAAAGLALINSFGNLGGFAGPYVMGIFARNGYGYYPGLSVFAFALIAGAAVAIADRRLDLAARRSQLDFGAVS